MNCINYNDESVTKGNVVVYLFCTLLALVLKPNTYLYKTYKNFNM